MAVGSTSVAGSRSTECRGTTRVQTHMKADRQTQPSQLCTQRHSLLPKGAISPVEHPHSSCPDPEAGRVEAQGCVQHILQQPPSATTSAWGQMHPTIPQACQGQDKQFFLCSDILANKGEPEQYLFSASDCAALLSALLIY